MMNWYLKCTLMLALFTSAYSLRAAFDGAFAVTNWTLVNTNADGSVDTSGAPTQIVVIGGNNQSFQPGYTEWRIAITNAATLNFDWRYSTADDDSGPFDRAGWRKNQSSTQLSANNNPTRSGNVSVEVAAGDTFAFWVFTEDNSVAPGLLAISNFVAGTSAPAPAFAATSLSNKTAIVRFSTIAGRTYRLEATPILPATNWNVVAGPFVAPGTNSTYAASVTNDSGRFFRAVLLP